VTAGWDSWGKIAVLRDGFDTKAWGKAWEHDVSSESVVDDGGSEAGAWNQRTPSPIHYKLADVDADLP
jgi:hypothetical protein